MLSTAVGWLLSLGSSLIVMIVLIILGLIFRVGWQKAVRGGITTGVGLAGLFLVVNVIVNALQPAVVNGTRFGVKRHSSMYTGLMRVLPGAGQVWLA
jgi:galactitol-specific phosphotransferase system IIC component